MKNSAGILLYRIQAGSLQVFLVHPGGPFWRNKDLGAWSIPKGEYPAQEDALVHAKREFWEETGQHVDGKFMALSPIKQKSGKLVYAWAVAGNINADAIKSNLITIAWPPKTGKTMEIAEVDKGQWFEVPAALLHINPAQTHLIKELQSLLADDTLSS